ncbi:MAG: DUF1361 domain-containing protein [Kouleothrix sp.]|nr:DUF1361 domain-containing protein [Kouleothrix sp.]
MNLRQRFYAIHVFLAQHMFYALALSTLLACVILAARVARVHHGTYVFLVWNLLLAWAPYLGSLWAAAIQQRHPRAWWRLLLPGALWLLFFPNAPYLVTDLIHLRERLPVPLWYDVGLLASFALSGCFLAVASLHTMQTIVRRVAGGAVSWLFVLGAVGLSGLGVYLGRVERWNSWDILLSPRAVLADAIRPILAPASHIHPIGIICMFAALLFICYVMFVATRLGGRPTAASSHDDAPFG